MKLRMIAIVAALCAAQAWAKLPPPPPADPAKAEEAKQKAAEAARKNAELQAKYEDRAAASYAAKAKADGKDFKPQLGSGIQPPPPPAPPAVIAAAPAVAVAAAPAKDVKPAAKK